MRRAVITLDTDATRADILKRVLAQECLHDDMARVGFESGGDSIEITIEAGDSVSLRAALNSYLRWMKISMETAAIT